MKILLEPKPNIKSLCAFFQKEALIASIDNCKQIKCVCVCVCVCVCHPLETKWLLIKSTRV